jgi:endonuclease I
MSFPITPPPNAIFSGPSYKGMVLMLKRWNVADPPNANERGRNNQIEKLEEIRNRFIDDQTLADQLQ